MSKTKLTFGEVKRQELSDLVRQTMRINERLKFRDLTWETLPGGQLSCGYLIGRANVGNALSLYTLNRRNGMKNLRSFRKVEIVLFISQYKPLAERIEGELKNGGYIPELSTKYCSRRAYKVKKFNPFL